MRTRERLRLITNRALRAAVQRTEISTPSESIRRVLEPEEIAAIYKEGAGRRWVPDWVTNDQGRKIGYRRSSIDSVE